MKNITALMRSTSATIWLVVIMTVLAEISSPFKTFLTGITGHHWVTKGVFALIFFVVLYILLAKAKESENLIKQATYVALSAILGGAVIFVFYLLHFYGLA